MAPRAGLEPTTYRLTAGCSTIELSRNICEEYIVAEKEGFEPSQQLPTLTV